MPFRWSIIKQDNTGFGMSVVGGEPNFKLNKEPNSSIKKDL
jgi:hypothetical protein